MSRPYQGGDGVARSFEGDPCANLHVHLTTRSPALTASFLPQCQTRARGGPQLVRRPRHTGRGGRAGRQERTSGKRAASAGYADARGLEGLHFLEGPELGRSLRRH